MVWKGEKRTREIKLTKPKVELNIIKKKSYAKTPSGLILSYAKKFHKAGNLENAILFQELYKKIKSMESSESFKAKSWKGKSGVKFLTYPDKVISIRYKKSEPNEEPKEIKREITKEEINRVIWAINQLNQKEWIETSEIGEKVYNISWKQVFSDRFKHTNLVEIFNYLEYKNWIEYSRSGKIKVLTKLEEQANLK